tara:strand:- start:363 stop:491 length:129 start_codon:yes stop_codon:yes gene_type:complete
MLFSFKSFGAAMEIQKYKPIRVSVDRPEMIAVENPEARLRVA